MSYFTFILERSELTMLPFLLEVVTDVWPVKLCPYSLHKPKYFFEVDESLDNARLKAI